MAGSQLALLAAPAASATSVPAHVPAAAFTWEGDSVHPHERLLVHICPPEGPAHVGHARSLEVAGGGQVGPVAQVHHGPAAVQADGGVIRQALDDLDLWARWQRGGSSEASGTA